MNKLMLTGLAFIVLGFICGVVEGMFYRSVNADGTVNESLYLFLSLIFTYAGMLALVASATLGVFKRVKQKLN